MSKVQLKPVSEAPRDYTTILLKIPGRDYLTRGRWASNGWAARTNMKYMDISFNETHQPTGWLPESDEYLCLLRPPKVSSSVNVRGLYADIPGQWERASA